MRKGREVIVRDPRVSQKKRLLDRLESLEKKHAKNPRVLQVISKHKKKLKQNSTQRHPKAERSSGRAARRK